MTPTRERVIRRRHRPAPALPDGTIVGYGPVVDDPALFPTFLAVPEEPGAHVVILDDDLLLMSSAAPETAALLADRGYRSVPVDISEYENSTVA